MIFIVNKNGTINTHYGQTVELILINVVYIKV